MSQLSPVPAATTTTSTNSSASSSMSFKSALGEAGAAMATTPVINTNGHPDDSSPAEEYSACRTTLPVAQPEKSELNLWSFLKQCIGKELTKITMPVQWNEPISLLQRVAEYMNYAYLLKMAAAQKDAEARLLWVSTFAVSALASNYERMGKPFNPLLGETYELKRNDFRIVCEQVGHHPPVSAFHADSRNTDTSEEGSSAGSDSGPPDFVFHGSVYPKPKFWGKSVEFQPKGTCSVELPASNETYTWSNVNCVVHIIGTMWMEHQGTMEITNQTTKQRCVLSFKPAGWFSGGGDLHAVEGFIVDRNKNKLKFVYGKWTEFLCAVDISSLEDHLGARVDRVDPSASNMPKHEPLALGAVPNSVVLWQAEPKAQDAEKYYNFSRFTMALNEMKDGMDAKICRSDSRQRPDIRALEIGAFEMAASEKARLEDKQREYRKPYKGKKEQDWWAARWFQPIKNEHTREDDWKYVGGYWDRKYADTPDIF